MECHRCSPRDRRLRAAGAGGAGVGDRGHAIHCRGRCAGQRVGQLPARRQSCRAAAFAGARYPRIGQRLGRLPREPAARDRGGGARSARLRPERSGWRRDQPRSTGGRGRRAVSIGRAAGGPARPFVGRPGRGLGRCKVPDTCHCRRAACGIARSGPRVYPPDAASRRLGADPRHAAARDPKRQRRADGIEARTGGAGPRCSR